MIFLLLITGLVAAAKGQNWYYSYELNSSGYKGMENFLRVAISDENRAAQVCASPLFYVYSSEANDTTVARKLRETCKKYPVTRRVYYSAADLKNYYGRFLEVFGKADNTKCRPIETVIELQSTVPASSGLFYPKCALVKQCSGCCLDGSACRATKTSSRTIEVVELQGSSVVFRDIVVDEHEECSCLDSCKRVCSPPHVLNKESCECECPAINCIGGFRPDPLTCQCCCNLTCTAGQTLKHDTCECIGSCELECPKGYSLDETRCQCQCSTKCPGGFVLTSECTCERPKCKLYCRPPLTLDDELCRCRCDLDCQGPYILNSERCKCDCSLTQSDCRPDQRFDERTCSCVAASCDTRSLLCNHGQFVDELTCSCRCPESSRICEGQLETYDEEFCGCQCPWSADNPYPDCEPGTEFDPCDCACVNPEE